VGTGMSDFVWLGIVVNEANGKQRVFTILTRAISIEPAHMGASHTKLLIMKKHIPTTFVSLRDLPKFFSEKFKKDKMIQLENRILFSSFWKEYAWRALSLALIRPKGRIANKLRLA
jgi:hypothetical protein